MKVTRIMHASVNVSGALEESRRFYAELLGLPDAARPEIPGVPGYWFRAADAQVHLVGSDELESGIDPSAHHICLAVDDIAAARAELRDRAIPFVEARQGDVEQIWISDPAGNVVELQENRPLV